MKAEFKCGVKQQTRNPHSQVLSAKLSGGNHQIDTKELFLKMAAFILYGINSLLLTVLSSFTQDSTWISSFPGVDREYDAAL